MINKELNILAEQLELNPNQLPKINEYDYDGNPFILEHNTHYEYVVQEGNTELRRDNYFTVDTLLYEVFKDITREIASDYEIANRVEKQDHRILLFNKQVELMRKLNNDWGNRLHFELKRYIDF